MSFLLSVPEANPRFVGDIGLYIQDSKVAFFRRYRPGRQPGVRGPHEPKWESTGFVTDLLWSKGRDLTPCVAFRDKGM